MQTSAEQRKRALIIAIILAAIFLASLVPLLSLARYNRPVLDDYSFAWQQAINIRQGLSFPGLRAAIENVSRYYYGWQGTFTGIAAMTLRPGVADYRLYTLSTAILLAALIFSTLFLLRSTKLFNWTQTLLVGAPLLFLAVQYVPNIREAFFWYNGSVLYTLLYCVQLVWLGLGLRLFKREGRSKALTAAVLILSFILGGANYITALLGVLFAAAIAACAFMFKKSRAQKTVFVLSFVLALAGLAISAAAPGNAVRGAALTGLSPVSAIIKSFLYAGRDLLYWTDPSTLLVIVALLPLFARAAERSGYKFKYPLLVMLASFCFFAAQNTPALFAQGEASAGRMRDIVWFMYLWLVFGNAFYLTGWLVNRLPEEKLFGKKRTYLALVAVALALCAVRWENTSGVTAAVCAEEMSSGRAQLYAQKWDARHEYLTAAPERDVELEAILDENSPYATIAPDSDIQESPDWWYNQALGYFYDKDTIRLKTS
ncbi:MAG: DUF6056 family protein [Oscillospiraceae bacterium]|jgi:hypothetical protein|nr:DUF6056 family protein [Oscillospiraceae bacterium]